MIPNHTVLSFEILSFFPIVFIIQSLKVNSKTLETHVTLERQIQTLIKKILLHKSILYFKSSFFHCIISISGFSDNSCPLQLFAHLMRLNTRHSANFQLHQIFDQSALPQPSSFNDFGNFIYKDHVTRIKYNLDYLKTKKLSTFHANETIQSFMKIHKPSKSTNNIGNIKTTKIQSDQMDQIQIKKRELLHFLEHLEMMNKIRKNRNHFVSGIEKVQKRKSFFPTLNQSLIQSKLKVKDIDMIKQQIRKQVNDLSTELFRDYIDKSQPYREVFNELSIASSKGALNTGKIKQIKQKIEECTKIKQDKRKSNNNNIVKRRQLDTKENQRYDKYFSNIAKQIDEEIHFKINHEASFNWKYGKRESADDMGKECSVKSKF